MQRYIRNFTRWRKGLNPSLSKQFFILTFMFVSGYGINFMQVNSLSQKVTSLNSELDKQTNLAVNNANALVAANLNVEVEKQTVKVLEKELANARATQQQQQQNLSFYKSVMAPEGAADGVYIESAELTQGSLENRYLLSFALAQLKKRKSVVKGVISGAISGTLDGKPKKLDLIKHLNQDFNSSFGFKYFQLVEGLITLPKGFKPERLSIKIRVPATRWSKAQQAESEFNFTDIYVSQ
ncbi:DUF6776 family protein [Paraferrimonas sp. SM1919]|uniref:DUF6776 family protein n=1 Tax=Paraferrimonas sp. SM1919 TaxID=2662263 RepID=UPI0013D5E0EC|nr:DUF6776 family protein [Paraferrimonas sp. SM1919]